jgi:riboflavin kinase/FMN adenylyltransferase
MPRNEIASGLTAHPVSGFPAGLRGGVVTIGNFDGVHRGHAALLKATVDTAASKSVRPVVLTFDPHPRSFFRPAEPVFRLTPLPARGKLFSALGIEAMAVATFDASFAGQSAEAFVDEILCRRLGICAAVIGYDFRFGKGRSGTPRQLVEAGRERGFSVSVVEPVKDGETLFTSRGVRASLREGNVAAAASVLGYRWFALGNVVGGDKRGRELGFPTANMTLWPDCDLRHGIYSVRFRAEDGVIRDGVANYGRRPTFDNGSPILETYVFDFDGDLYGQDVSVALVDWIRPEEKFSSVDELIVAMKRDEGIARRQLAAARSSTALDLALGTG